jgi:hypothetical protein
MRYQLNFQKLLLLSAGNIVGNLVVIADTDRVGRSWWSYQSPYCNNLELEPGGSFGGTIKSVVMGKNQIQLLARLDDKYLSRF